MNKPKLTPSIIAKTKGEKIELKKHLESKDGLTFELTKTQLDALCTYGLIQNNALPTDLAQLMFRYVFKGLFAGYLSAIPEAFKSDFKAMYSQQIERSNNILLVYQLIFYTFPILELIEKLTGDKMLDETQRSISQAIPVEFKRHYWADVLYLEPNVNFTKENVPFFKVRDLELKRAELFGEKLKSFTKYNISKKLDYGVKRLIKPKLVELIQNWAYEKINNKELCEQTSQVVNEFVESNVTGLLD